MQAAELHNLEKPPQQPGKAGTEEVLPVLPSSHCPQGNALTAEKDAPRGEAEPSPSRVVSRAIDSLRDSKPLQIRILPEKAAELEAAVRSSLRLSERSGGAHGDGEFRHPPCEPLDSVEPWPALAGSCSLASLTPLGALLEPLLSTEEIGVLHAEQTLELMRIPRVNEQLSAAAYISKSRPIRDSYLLQVTEKLQDLGGNDVVIGLSTLFVAPHTALQGPSSSQPSSAVSSSPTQGRAPVASGSGLAGPVELARYGGASGDFNPIHFDEEYARRAGFARPIVHGMLLYNWVLWIWATLTQGPVAFRTRIRFVTPLLSGEPATVELYEDSSFAVSKESGSHRELVAKGSIHTSQ